MKNFYTEKKNCQLTHTGDPSHQVLGQSKRIEKTWNAVSRMQHLSLSPVGSEFDLEHKIPCRYDPEGFLHIHGSRRKSRHTDSPLPSLNESRIKLNSRTDAVNKSKSEYSKGNKASLDKEDSQAVFGAPRTKLTACSYAAAPPMVFNERVVGEEQGGHDTGNHDTSFSVGKKRSRKYGNFSHTAPLHSRPHTVASRCEFRPQTSNLSDLGLQSRRLNLNGISKIKSNYRNSESPSVFHTNVARLYSTCLSPKHLTSKKMLQIPNHHPSYNSVKPQVRKVNWSLKDSVCHEDWSPDLTGLPRNYNSPTNLPSTSPSPSSTLGCPNAASTSTRPHRQALTSLPPEGSKNLKHVSRQLRREPLNLENSPNCQPVRENTMRVLPFPIPDKESKAQKHEIAKTDLTPELSRDVSQRPFFFGKMHQNASSPPHVLTREQCIWDLKQLRKTLVSHSTNPLQKRSHISQFNQPTHTRSFPLSNDSNPFLNSMRSNEAFSQMQSNGVFRLQTDATHLRCQNIIKSLKSENAYLRERLGRQGRKITVLEAHMERDEGIISRYEQCLNSIKTYLRKLKRDCDTPKNFETHITHLLSFVSKEHDVSLSPLLSCRSTDASLDDQPCFKESSQLRLPREHQSPYAYYTEPHSLYFKENESNETNFYPNYPVDSFPLPYDNPKLSQTMPLHVKHSNFPINSSILCRPQHTLKKNRSNCATLNEVRTSLSEESPHAVSGEEETENNLSSGKCSQRHTDVSSKTFQPTGSIKSENESRESYTPKDKVLSDSSTHRSFHSSILPKSSYVKSTASRHDKRKPPVPLLGLEKRNVGFGSWLSGEATQGDTYNVPVNPVPSN